MFKTNTKLDRLFKLGIYTTLLTSCYSIFIMFQNREMKKKMNKYLNW